MWYITPLLPYYSKIPYLLYYLTDDESNENINDLIDTNVDMPVPDALFDSTN